MTKQNPKVNAFFKEATQWREEMEQLRKILLGCGLDEELKWSKPCYSVEGSNVIVIQPFKAYCALLFFKGYMMKDPKGVLIKTGPNTVVGRQIRFTSVGEVVKMTSILKSYIKQAIEVEKSGAKVELPKKSDLVIPEEFKKKLRDMPALKTAFDALTPGRQKGYIFYFSGAKQSKTREDRIEKCMDLILDGKGLLDDYQARKK